MYMHQEDSCDTGLALGLSNTGRGSEGASIHNKVPLEPSLTLSLSDDTYGSATPKLELNKLTKEANSIVSSFSSAYPSIKKEKDMPIEDMASWRVSDEEEDGGARKKLRLTKEQSALLEDRFKEHSTLNPKQKQALAKQLNLRPRQVEVWFQNRRARTKLKQTEVDCEFLKRCYESLTDENRRLQKELQELRALKFPPQPPLYMQFPAVCPSCERIGGGGDGSTKGGGTAPFVVATKPRFFNPFTHPAAC